MRYHVVVVAAAVAVVDTAVVAVFAGGVVAVVAGDSGNCIMIKFLNSYCG